MPTVAFYCCIAGLWTFVYVMALIGPLVHRHDIYVRASAWVFPLAPLKMRLKLPFAIFDPRPMHKAFAQPDVFGAAFGGADLVA